MDVLQDGVDGVINTFIMPEPDTKWSYAKLDPVTQDVVDVQEKKPISDIATTGIYYWRKGGWAPCLCVSAARVTVPPLIRHLQSPPHTHTHTCRL